MYQNVRVFLQMARTVSTPHHGHGFLPEPDDNTSKVNILFKVPLTTVDKKEDLKVEKVQTLFF
jgi:hypothetical protein